MLISHEARRVHYSDANTFPINCIMHNLDTHANFDLYWLVQTGSTGVWTNILFQNNLRTKHCLYKLLSLSRISEDYDSVCQESVRTMRRIYVRKYNISLFILGFFFYIAISHEAIRMNQIFNITFFGIEKKYFSDIVLAWLWPVSSSQEYSCSRWSKMPLWRKKNSGLQNACNSLSEVAT